MFWTKEVWFWSRKLSDLAWSGPASTKEAEESVRNGLELLRYFLVWCRNEFAEANEWLAAHRYLVARRRYFIFEGRNGDGRGWDCGNQDLNLSESGFEDLQDLGNCLNQDLQDLRMNRMKFKMRIHRGCVSRPDTQEIV